METNIAEDGAAELCSSRTKPVKPDDAAGNDLLSVEEILKNLKRLRAPTLSHLLAMIIHTPPDLITERTNLLVIDDINILLAIDHPRQPFTSAAKTEQQKWQASRRYGILGSVVSALNKLAVLRNIAIIVTTGCSTRPRTESGLGLALVPGVGGTEWETGIWNRLIIFRDFGRRFVGIQKLQGKSQISREEVGETGRLIVFDVSSHGAVQEPLSNKSADDAITALAKARIIPIRPRKRAFDEVADSDGEDVDEYGWADADDDAIAAEGLINDAPNADRPTEIK